MRPGDLVRVTSPCSGEIKRFRGGELGMIIGWGTTSTGVVRNDLYMVLFPEGLENFSSHLLETVDESR